MKALKKLGFVASKSSGGTHVTYTKKTASGTRTCTAVLAKPEIRPGTLKGILKQGGIELEDFMIALGGSYKREAKAEKKKRES